MCGILENSFKSVLTTVNRRHKHQTVERDVDTLSEITTMNATLNNNGKSA